MTGIIHFEARCVHKDDISRSADAGKVLFIDIAAAELDNCSLVGALCGRVGRDEVELGDKLDADALGPPLVLRSGKYDLGASGGVSAKLI